MRKIRRAVSLLPTIILVCMVRIALWLLPFRQIKAHIVRLSQATIRYNDTRRRDKKIIVQRVIRASRFIPRATCLTQAIATMILFRHYHYPAMLRIGVGRNHQGEFEAHAWVESDERIMIGGSKTELYKRYALFPSFF